VGLGTGEPVAHDGQIPRRVEPEQRLARHEGDVRAGETHEREDGRKNVRVGAVFVARVVDAGDAHQKRYAHLLVDERAAMAHGPMLPKRLPMVARNDENDVLLSATPSAWRQARRAKPPPTRAAK